ncbi:MAG: hypothetical protein NC416_17335, partial [Eubacterium sp.]|nr:hypothetical protein [Eubacterium sp.]
AGLVDTENMRFKLEKGAETMNDKIKENTTMANEPQETGKTAESVAASTQKGNKKWYAAAGVAIVIILALLIGINIYNSPQRRLNRLLDLGNTYLNNGQYEEAALTFEQAIAIDDRCIEAYAGGVEAYRNLDDAAGETAFYNKALAVLEDMDEGLAAEKVDYVVEIYLAAEDVYSFDRSRAIETLERGYVATKEDPRVTGQLVSDYIEVSKEGEYEERLAIFDRLLELDGENAEVQQNMKEMLTEYIGVLIEKEEFDTIGELIDRYDEIAQEVVDEYVEQYIDEAQGYTDSGSYEEGEVICDLLLNLDGDSGSVQSFMQDFLQKYIDALIAEMRYDEVRSLIEKYRELVPGMDFDAVLAQIEELEEAARLAGEEEQARIAEAEQAAARANTAANSGQQAAQSQAGFSYDEIPPWIRSGEWSVWKSGIPETWSEEQRKEVTAMWDSLWGEGSCPLHWR